MSLMRLSFRISSASSILVRAYLMASLIYVVGLRKSWITMLRKICVFFRVCFKVFVSFLKNSSCILILSLQKQLGKDEWHSHSFFFSLSLSLSLSLAAKVLIDRSDPLRAGSVGSMP